MKMNKYKFETQGFQNKKSALTMILEVEKETSANAYKLLLVGHMFVLSQ